MCGRFTLTTPRDLLADLFQLLKMPPIEPRYNIAPSQPVLAVRREASGPGRIAGLMRWGLIPAWVQDPAAAPQPINLRAESFMEKASFKARLERRRCLLPADGFYEWQAVAKDAAAAPNLPGFDAPRESARRSERRGGPKQPYCIRMRDGRPFGFAAIWDTWHAGEESEVLSCAIVTTEANEIVRPIHDRMPVILPPEACVEWLSREARDAGRLLPLLRPFPADRMEAYPVGPWVNNPRTDDPRCVERLTA